MIIINTKSHYGYGASVDDGSRPFSFVAQATTNLAMIKPGPGVITMIHAINVNAAIRYLKFFDASGSNAPVVGTTKPWRRFGVPAATTGAGFGLPIIAPLKFDFGIWVCLVTGIADSDATAPSANDAVIDIEFI